MTIFTFGGFMKHADYVERKQHGTSDFPIEYYYIDEMHPRYFMSAHWHKEFEIVRVREGRFFIHLNNVGYDLRKGDILLVPVGYLHRGDPDEAAYECLVFDPAMLLVRPQGAAAEKFIAPIKNSNVVVKNIVDNSDIGETVNELFESMKTKKYGYELEVYAQLFKLFSQLYTNGYILADKTVSCNKQTQTIMKLTEYLEENFRTNIDLDNLAQYVGLNKKYLCKIFKEYTSRTLVEYVNELRIENACYEISISGKNVTEAAFESGFNDSGYFCKMFKRYKGITPGEYKSSVRSHQSQLSG